MESRAHNAIWEVDVWNLVKVMKILLSLTFGIGVVDLVNKTLFIHYRQSKSPMLHAI